ncbi:unnamed protein product [Onchocerca flexuosa]|uniref:F-box domain-containing protein n=1 Tax=Onchocerca flexuosa TaxID=387005 RepID=A0A183I8I7_9BILA|nr:unnamed protein product [Onchocerca flexuosa]
MVQFPVRMADWLFQNLPNDILRLLEEKCKQLLTIALVLLKLNLT